MSFHGENRTHVIIFLSEQMHYWLEHYSAFIVLRLGIIMCHTRASRRVFWELRASGAPAPRQTLVFRVFPGQRGRRTGHAGPARSRTALRFLKRSPCPTLSAFGEPRGARLDSDLDRVRAAGSGGHAAAGPIAPNRADAPRRVDGDLAMRRCGITRQPRLLQCRRDPPSSGLKLVATLIRSGG